MSICLDGNCAEGLDDQKRTASEGGGGSEGGKERRTEQPTTKLLKNLENYVNPDFRNGPKDRKK